AHDPHHGGVRREPAGALEVYEGTGAVAGLLALHSPVREGDGVPRVELEGAVEVRDGALPVSALAADVRARHEDPGAAWFQLEGALEVGVGARAVALGFRGESPRAQLG